MLLTCWIFTLLTCYFYKETILFMLIDSSNYAEQYFIFTDISEIFYVYLQLTFFVSNQVTLMMLFYHSIIFLSSGLYKSEYEKLQFAFQVYILSWICSMILLNKIIIPVSWDFFLSFQSFHLVKSFSMDFEARILEYYSFFEKFYFICVLYFQVFLIPVLFFRYIKKDLYFRFRKVFYYCCVVFATTITPPDVLSQICLSLFIIIGCEFLVYYFIIKNILTA